MRLLLALALACCGRRRAGPGPAEFPRRYLRAHAAGRGGRDAEPRQGRQKATSSTTSARATAASRSPRPSASASAPTVSTSDPQRIQEANENARKNGVTNLVQFRQEDLFKSKFSNATVVTLYLLPDLNVKLRPRLLSELKPGTRIVSHQFDMGRGSPTGSRAERPDYLLMDDPAAPSQK